MLSENSFSIKSSMLNDEMLAQRRKNERYAFFIGVFAQFIWALNSIQLKTYQRWFPEAFSNNSLAFWRSVPIWGLGYYFSWKKNIRILPIKEIKHPLWFWSRSLGNYLCLVLWIQMLKYFRVSTCQCIAGCFPVIVLFLSILILKETFYIRYLAGIFFCLIGTSIIVLNERKSSGSSQETNNSQNIFFGCIFGCCHLFFNALSNFGQKILCKQHLSGELQNYYLGMYNSLPALIMMIIENHYGLSNIYYVLYGLSNGFLFYVGNYYTTIALDNIALSKFIPITYMLTVFLFIMGFIFFHEKVYFTDVLGSLMILGFQLYNVWVPVSKK